MNRRALYLGIAGSALAGTAAGAAWAGAGLATTRIEAGAVALLAATAFACGCAAGRFSRAEGEPESAPELEVTRQLEAARREALAARREVESLQSSVVHDLRSPVGAVLNFATVLELDHGPELDEGAREIVQRIRRSAESGLAMLDALNRLNVVARAKLSPVPLDVEPLLRRAYADASPGRERPALTVDSLPQRPVADPELLQVAFTELFDNALKFSAGRPDPRISVGGRRDPDGSLVYWVADSGAGFDMRFAGKLFGTYERVHSREEFPGAGVGLAMVRRIAERHGGRAWIEAEPGCGARAFLALPPESGPAPCA